MGFEIIKLPIGGATRNRPINPVIDIFYYKDLVGAGCVVCISKTSLIVLNCYIYVCVFFLRVSYFYLFNFQNSINNLKNNQS